MVLGEDDEIDVRDLAGLLPDPPPVPTGAATRRPAPDIVDPQMQEIVDPLSLWQQEHALLVQALERAGQNQTRAADILKISREPMRTRMKRYGLLTPKL
ncbi:MAG: helix-turn-helix domain-containing protein [Acidobacteriota bacterium]